MVITRVLVGFVRTLRHAGVAATPDRVHAMLAAVGELGATDPKALYWAGRLTLCSEPDDLPVYDATFAAYFGGRVAVPGLPLPTRPPLARVSAPLATGAPGREINDGEPPEILALSASPVEVRRHRDGAALSSRERAEGRGGSDLQRRLGARRPGRPGRAARPALPAGVTVGLGEPAPGQDRLRTAGRRDGRGAAVPRRFRGRPQPGRAGGPGGGDRPCVTYSTTSIAGGPAVNRWAWRQSWRPGDRRPGRPAR